MYSGVTCLLCFSSTLVLDKKLVHVVYSKLDRDVLVIAMPAEKYVHQELSNIDSYNHELHTIKMTCNLQS